MQLTDLELLHHLQGHLGAIRLAEYLFQDRRITLEGWGHGAVVQGGQPLRGPVGQQGILGLHGVLRERLLGRRAVGTTFSPPVGGQGRGTPTLTPAQGLQQQPVGATMIRKTLHQGTCPRDGLGEIPGTDQALHRLELSRFGLLITGRIGL